MIDYIVKNSEFPEDFKELEEGQKIIGALELLKSYSFRSGVDMFFEQRSKHLWNYALLGLEKTDAIMTRKYLKNLIYNFKSNAGYRYLNKLQDAIIIKEYEIISKIIEDTLKDIQSKSKRKN